MNEGGDDEYKEEINKMNLPSSSWCLRVMGSP